jgi:hypothetical protein
VQESIFLKLCKNQKTHTERGMLITMQRLEKH